MIAQSDVSGAVRTAGATNDTREVDRTRVKEAFRPYSPDELRTIASTLLEMAREKERAA